MTQRVNIGILNKLQRAEFKGKAFMVLPTILLSESIFSQLINDEAHNAETIGETLTTGLFQPYENIPPGS